MSDQTNLLKAVFRLRRAHVEQCRAGASGEPERIWRAGNRHAVARIKLFALADRINEVVPAPRSPADREGSQAPDVKERTDGPLRR